jgi:hypothetical protein
MRLSIREFKPFANVENSNARSVSERIGNWTEFMDGDNC